VPSHPVSPHLLLPWLPEEEKFNFQNKTVTLCMHVELEENESFRQQSQDVALINFHNVFTTYTTASLGRSGAHVYHQA
jgi:hypothetical protein